MCGFNPICYVGEFLGPWWFWIKLGGIVIAALVVLGILAKLKEIGGWPLVWVAVTAGLTTWAWSRGRAGKSLLPYPVENVDPDSPDAKRSFDKPKTSALGKPVSRRRGDNEYVVDPYTGAGSWQKREARRLSPSSSRHSRAFASATSRGASGRELSNGNMG